MLYQPPDIENKCKIMKQLFCNYGNVEGWYSCSVQPGQVSTKKHSFIKQPKLGLYFVTDEEKLYMLSHSITRELGQRRLVFQLGPTTSTDMIVHSFITLH